MPLTFRNNTERRKYKEVIKATKADKIKGLHNTLPFLVKGLGVGLLLLFYSCARMGAPDGGWYDETPPRVIGTSPADRGTDVTQKRVSIYFDEYIKVENAQEKVVISPPQLEQADIKTQGKRIMIQLKDSLKPNTTYTIDFSDAIVDNNEGNPMGNYTFSFSTGDHIDTLECSGYVLSAEDLEPVKGILVGLYNRTDTLVADTLPFLRVSRTDSRGHFVIRGIAPGTYCVGAVQDVDGDFRFSQRSEMMAFSHQLITPTSFLDHRQDTLWADALHIKDIKRIPYTHFKPDDIVLRAFTHPQTERFFLKSERTDPDRFTLFFTAPVSVDSLARFDGTATTQPQLRLLNAPESVDMTDWYVLEQYAASADTLTYWLRDTTLINQDTLFVEMTTLQTDTAGTLRLTTDTIEVLAKTPLAKRLKKQEEARKEWRKDIEKKLKDREKQLARLDTEEERRMVPEVDTVMPVPRLTPKYEVKQSMDPDGSIRFSFPYPLARIDTAAVHLYVEQDSMWFRAPYVMHTTDTLSSRRNWELYSEWIPGARYSFEVDTLAFEDIYGNTSVPYKTGIRIRELNEYASLFVNITETDTCDVMVELLNSSDKPVRMAKTKNGTAEFYYVTPGKYFMRAFIDRNGNGTWDAGDYYNDIQPEEVFYFQEELEFKPKWDYTKQWTLRSVPLFKQKPSSITKVKADKQKTIKHRNADRAKEKGIPMPEK